MPEWAIAILSFLGGALLAGAGFMFAYTSRLAKLEVMVSNIVQKLNDMTNTTPSVPQSVSDKLINLTGQCCDIERRLHTLEMRK